MAMQCCECTVSAFRFATDAIADCSIVWVGLPFTSYQEVQRAFHIRLICRGHPHYQYAWRAFIMGHFASLAAIARRVDLLLVRGSSRTTPVSTSLFDGLQHLRARGPHSCLAYGAEFKLVRGTETANLAVRRKSLSGPDFQCQRSALGLFEKSDRYTNHPLFSSTPDCISSSDWISSKIGLNSINPLVPRLRQCCLFGCCRCW